MVTSGTSDNKDICTTELEFNTANDGSNPKLCYLLPWLHCMQLYHMYIEGLLLFSLQGDPTANTTQLQSALKRGKKVSRFLGMNAGVSAGLLIIWVLSERPLARPNVSSLFKYMSGILCDTPQAFLPVTNFL